MRGLMRSVLRVVGVAVVGLGASAAAESGGMLAGVYVGHEVGAPRDAVTLEVRGSGLLLSDRAGVWLGAWQLTPHGPGTKTGGLTMLADLTLQAALARDGKPLRPKRGKLVLARLRYEPDTRQLTLCTGEPAATAKRATRPAGLVGWGAMEVGEAGVRCFHLERVRGPATEPDPECVRECIAQNQMRAVSAEQIEADCRQGCLER